MKWIIRVPCQPPHPSSVLYTSKTGNKSSILIRVSIKFDETAFSDIKSVLKKHFLFGIQIS